MKAKLLLTLTAVALFLMPNASFGQTINLGTAANFVLFSTDGAVTNTGFSHLTGHVGTSNGSSTGFGNVNGVMNNNNGVSATASADLLLAYNQLNNAIPTFNVAGLLGNGSTLVPGIYAIGGPASLNLDLTLDAQNDPNALFIFQIGGAFSTNAASKVKLINGAMACNVYWKVEGLVSMASGTSFKGTIIANNAAISISSNDTIEGRLLTTAGAVTTNGLLAYTPVGCGSPYLQGPAAPNLKTTACFSLFSADGPVSNTGISNVLGDIGTNVGLTTGFDALLVGGNIHPIPDVKTATAAADLLTVYNYISTLPYDIELLYPAQFGNDLVLTPHTYLLNAATVLTDSLYLNAQGNANAVFVIKIYGALSTSTYSKVLLMNGAQAKNVYWLIEGAVSINNYSVFCGTIVCNNGALGAINTGVTLNGRALTTTGALTTASITTTLPISCLITGANALAPEKTNALSIAPNPFNAYTTIVLNDASKVNNYKLMMYNMMGKEVMNTIITNQLTTLEMKDLQSGIYFYKVLDNNKIIQSGKLISKK